MAPPTQEEIGRLKQGAVLIGFLAPLTQPETIKALDSAGVGNEIISYEGAPHSFFDRKAAEHAGASEDAWRRMLAFIRPGT